MRQSWILITVLGIASVAHTAAADTSCGITVTDAIDVGCLPALTADRKSVLVPITDPDGARGNPNLSVRVQPVSGKGAAKTLPVISPKEWDQWGDADRATKAKARLADVNHALGAGFTRIAVALPSGNGEERQDFDTTVGDLQISGHGDALTFKRGGAKLATVKRPATQGRGMCKGVNWSFARAVYIDDNVAVVHFDQHGNDSCLEGAGQWVVTTIGAARPTPSPAKAPDMKPPSDADDRSADKLWMHEAFGPLQMSMTAKQVTDELGKPKQQSPIEKEEATGAYVSTWDYNGVSLVLSATSKQGKQTVNAITLHAPSRFTTRGVGIGASATELARAYDKATWNKESTTDERVVIGSVYGGIIFTLVDHKITEIFVGASAE